MLDNGIEVFIKNPKSGYWKWKQLETPVTKKNSSGFQVAGFSKSLHLS